MVDNYLKFSRNKSGKANTRFELSDYSEPVYDQLNREFIYLIKTPEKIKAKSQRKTNFGLYQKEWISSLFIPDISKPNYSFGDIKNTEDLILVIISDDHLEIFVCKGKKNLFQSVLNLFFDGELNEDIERIRQRALSKNISNSLELVK